MAGMNKVETYLIDLGLSYEEVGANTWLVEDQAKGIPPIMIALAEPIIVIRANVMAVPKADREVFFHELLKLNAGQLMHGAYGIDGDNVILIETHDYDTLDKSELETAIDAIGFALSEQYPLLSRFGKK